MSEEKEQSPLEEQHRIEVDALEEFGSSSSWRLSRKFFKKLGPPHGLFERAIRTLRRPKVMELQEDQWQSFYVANVDLGHLYLSPNVRSVLYFAGKTIHKEKFEALPNITGPQLLSLFSPAELSAVLAVTYLYRHVRKLISPEFWDLIEKEGELQMEAGMWIGRHITSIGIDKGLIASAIRFYGMVLISAIDEKRFRKYWRVLNNKEKLCDVVIEEEEWGCSHLQIASLILQSYGFGIPATRAMLAYTDAKAQLPHLDQETKQWLASLLWLRAALEEDKPPSELKDISDFRASGDVNASLQKHLEEINEQGVASFDWITKKSSDLPPEIAESIRSLRKRRGPIKAADSSKSAPEEKEDVEPAEDDSEILE